MARGVILDEAGAGSGMIPGGCRLAAGSGSGVTAGHDEEEAPHDGRWGGGGRHWPGESGRESRLASGFLRNPGAITRHVSGDIIIDPLQPQMGKSIRWIAMGSRVRSGVTLADGTRWDPRRRRYRSRQPPGLIPAATVPTVLPPPPVMSCCWCGMT